MRRGFECMAVGNVPVRERACPADETAIDLLVIVLESVADLMDVQNERAGLRVEQLPQPFTPFVGVLLALGNALVRVWPSRPFLASVGERCR